ncbi:MAG: nucleotidyltransferase family protein [Planctomycetes bacterium]|nr:nucleotidyltransferase family protein [Planctomycetota bacterium]
MISRIPVDRRKIAEFCRRQQIRYFALFGSVLSDEFRPDSDVDVLVEFQPERKIGYMGLVGLERELSTILAGRRVDLVTRAALHPLIQDRVFAEAEVLFVEG